MNPNEKAVNQMIELMSKDEKSLLLFLETRGVDYGGRINIKHMNQEDMQIAERWSKEGFLEFGRIVIRNHNSDGTHYVKIPDSTFMIAHKLRLERAKRMYLNKTWLSTKESRKMHGDPHSNKMNNPEKLQSNPYTEEYN